MSQDLRERLAAIEHERWAGWQRYMHGLCERHDDGSLTVPAHRVERWERQIATPYADLSEQEKQSDRDQVDRYWPLISAELDRVTTERDEIAEKLYECGGKLDHAETVGKRLSVELAETKRSRDETEQWRQQLVRQVRELQGRLNLAERKLHSVRMVKLWKNEDGKWFVFADDLWAATDPEAQRKPDSSQPTPSFSQQWEKAREQIVDGARRLVADGQPDAWQDLYAGVAALAALESTPDGGQSIPVGHPEHRCNRCGGPNITWAAPSPLWNEVMRGGDINGADSYDGIVCPICFAQLAAIEGIAYRWRLYAEDVKCELTMVTPSGRVWHTERWLWVDPSTPDGGEATQLQPDGTHELVPAPVRTMCGGCGILPLGHEGVCYQ